MVDTSDKTVLIVDDEEMVAESYELYLQDDYETIVELSGGAALMELDQREVDLVLVDRRMPGMSGDVVIDHIDQWEMDFQVIMVTAVDPDIDIIDMPCDGYLTKPVSEDELLDAVNRAFQIDYYEDLIAEYNQLSEKYDVLTSQFSSRELANKDRFTDLEARMEEMEAEIAETAEGFSDSKLSDAFRRLH
jgi:DNA-binding response OmpR family regulator